MKRKSSLFVKLPLYCIFILLSLACATTGNTGIYKERYEEIVEMTGSKDSIYTKSNLIFVDVFRHADAVIQYSDKEAGVIKGKYISTINVGLTGSYNVVSIIEVSAKDGKYRISMSIADITTRSSWDGRMISVAPNDTVLKPLNDEWQNLAACFHEEMLKDSSW